MSEWQKREQERMANGTYKVVPAMVGLARYPESHYLHLSVTETETDMVAYTPSQEYGKADRQVRLKFGRYLRKTFVELTDSEVQGYVTELRTALSLESSTPDLHFATDRETINRIFETEMCAYDSSCTSCMYGKFAGENRPYHVYADSPDVAVAYTAVGERIIARTVVATGKKQWVRCYSVADGVSATDCSVLETLLGQAGYRAGDLFGCRLSKLPTKSVMLPYIDNGGCSVVDNGRYWEVVEGRGDYVADCTDGTATECTPKCERCDCDEDECECVYCDCCSESFYQGCDNCNMCSRCECCTSHNNCNCDRCSECGEFLEAAGRYETECECERCTECNSLVDECECEKCEKCERLKDNCECEEECEEEATCAPATVTHPVPEELSAVARYLLKEYAGLGLPYVGNDHVRDNALNVARRIVSSLEYQFMSGEFLLPEMVPGTPEEARNKLNRAYCYLRNYPGQVWDRGNGVFALMVAAVERTRIEEVLEVKKSIRMSAVEVARVRSMLEYRRPARSQREEAFITRYIDTIPGVYADGYGNRLLLEPGAKVLISCHTDSVHRMQGKQEVSVSRAGIAALSKHEADSNCLGADDVAGVYAAIRMIEAGVKGVSYVFHRDEESGGRGSAWLAEHYPEWLSQFDICLALDRRGTKDIIVTQSWGKCASDEFAAGLGAELGMGHKVADGVFTDSANYVDLIPECSNISVGYQHEHSSRETLDLGYLESLVQALTAVEWGNVPVVREPGDSGYCGFSSGGMTDDTGYDTWEVELLKEMRLQGYGEKTIL